jgi:hypothetical protein
MGLADRISASVVDVRAHAQRLVQLNIELLKAELQKKGQQYGIAVGLFVVAAVLALYAFGLLLALIVVALALVLPLWLSFLIVIAALFVVILVLVSIGRGRVQQAKTSGLQSVAEAQATAGQLRDGLKGVVNGVGVRAPKPGATAPAAPTAPPPPTGEGS